MKKCNTCKKMFYCDKLCQRKDWKRHKFECALFVDNYKILNKTIDRFILRLYLYLQNNPNLKRKTFSYMSDPTVVRSFDDLLLHQADIENDDLRMKCFDDLRLKFTLCSILFSENELFEYFCKICINSFSIFNTDLNEIGVGLYVMESIFDHSCIPNAAPIFNGNYLEIRAIKDIDSDDKMTINYIDLIDNKTARKMSLKKQYYFECNCNRCQSDFDNGKTKVLFFFLLKLILLFRI